MMFRKSYLLLPLAGITLLWSCRSSREISSTGNTGNVSAQSYIETYRDIAVSEMKRTGVPASITLAQGMVESGLGRGTVAQEANNHFGIKCHDDWTGPTIRHTDDRRNECFRKYRKPEESYKDHSDFLRSEKRYSFLFDLDPTDYKGWARGLKKAGYATNPDYANMLIRKIEEYRLYEYDKGKVYAGRSKEVQQQAKVNGSDSAAMINEPTLNKSDDPVVYRALPARIKETNRIQYIIVNDRDTKKSLEQEFKLLPWELQKYNELGTDFTLLPGQKLYLQPKRDKAGAGNDFHTVKEGETMYSISQLYGIKLAKLYQMNRMDEGTEPETGRKLWLRSVRPVD